MNKIQIPSTEKRPSRTKLNQAGAMTALALVLTSLLLPPMAMTAQRKRPPERRAHPRRR